MVSSTPRPHFTPGKDPVPILEEAGWAPGPVWTGRKSRPHRDSIPDRPARSQSLYRLSYPAHIQYDKVIYSSTAYICNHQYMLATCFGSSEPSSGQFLIHTHGVCSECAHYGIPCCLQTILILKFNLKIYSPMYLLKFLFTYFKRYIGE